MISLRSIADPVVAGLVSNGFFGRAVLESPARVAAFLDSHEDERRPPTTIGVGELMGV